MTKIELVRGEMIAAMKAGDKPRKEALSMLLSALKNKSIDKRDDLTEEEENEVVLKEIKQTKESLETAPADRMDIINHAKYKIEVYEEFAPKFLSEEEIKELIKEILTSLSITAPTIKDKGRIMKELMPKVKGRSDGKVVNELVSSFFQV